MPEIVQILPMAHHSNTASLLAALRKLAFDAKVLKAADPIDPAKPLIIPGVGRYSEAMKFLHRSGKAEEIILHGGKLAPIVGICLGFQILCQSGSEGEPNPVQGLGLLRGRVEPLGVHGTHFLNIGWHRVDGTPALESEDRMYFCHSYHVVGAQGTLNFVRVKDLRVTAQAAVGGVIGMQFHPELSGAPGLKRLGLALGPVETPY